MARNYGSFVTGMVQGFSLMDRYQTNQELRKSAKDRRERENTLFEDGQEDRRNLENRIEFDTTFAGVTANKNKQIESAQAELARLPVGDPKRSALQKQVSQLNAQLDNNKWMGTETLHEMGELYTGEQYEARVKAFREGEKTKRQQKNASLFTSNLQEATSAKMNRLTYLNGALETDGGGVDSFRPELTQERDQIEAQLADNNWMVNEAVMAAGKEDSQFNVDAARELGFNGKYDPATGDFIARDTETPIEGISFVPGPDGISAVAEVRSVDGSVQPITENRSNDPNDPVKIIPTTREKIKNLMGAEFVNSPVYMAMQAENAIASEAEVSAREQQAPPSAPSGQQAPPSGQPAAEVPEYITRINDPDQPSITNEDGSVSTHRMAADVGEDGKWYAYPMIQMIDGELVVFDDPREAMAKAMETGNFTSFGEDKKGALAYAEGGYKKGTPMDPSSQQEGETGIDYEIRMMKAGAVDEGPDRPISFNNQLLDARDNYNRRLESTQINEGDSRATKAGKMYRKHAVLPALYAAEGPVAAWTVAEPANQASSLGTGLWEGTVDFLKGMVGFETLPQGEQDAIIGAAKEGAKNAAPDNAVVNNQGEVARTVKTTSDYNPKKVGSSKVAAATAVAGAPNLTDETVRREVTDKYIPNVYGTSKRKKPNFSDIVSAASLAKSGVISADSFMNYAKTGVFGDGKPDTRLFQVDKNIISVDNNTGVSRVVYSGGSTGGAGSLSEAKFAFQLTQDQRDQVDGYVDKFIDEFQGEAGEFTSSDRQNAYSNVYTAHADGLINAGDPDEVVRFLKNGQNMEKWTDEGEPYAWQIWKDNERKRLTSRSYEAMGVATALGIRGQGEFKRFMEGYEIMAQSRVFRDLRPADKRLIFAGDGGSPPLYNQAQNDISAYFAGEISEAPAAIIALRRLHPNKYNSMLDEQAKLRGTGRTVRPLDRLTQLEVARQMLETHRQ